MAPASRSLWFIEENRLTNKCKEYCTINYQQDIQVAQRRSGQVSRMGPQSPRRDLLRFSEALDDEEPAAQSLSKDCIRIENLARARL